jgi:hypothetical protein
LVIGRNGKVLICGDFNIDMISNCDTSSKLCEVMHIYGLTSLVNSPTRETESSSKAIDLVLTNILSENDNPCKVINLGISGHYAQLLHIPKTKDLSYKAHCRFFPQDSVNHFSKQLGEMKWDGLYRLKNVQEMYSYFIDNLKLMFEECFPKKSSCKS